MTNSGLTSRDIKILKDIFKKYPDVILVSLFGSRAKGSYKKGSDVDLAVMNEGLDPRSINKIKNDIEESSLPYLVDLIDYTQLSHTELKDHIERAGVEFYRK